MQEEDINLAVVSVESIKSLDTERDDYILVSSPQIPFIGVPNPNSSLQIWGHGLEEEDWGSLGFLIHSHPFV